MSDPYLDDKDPVWLILAPAVRWFKDRPNCADATEALARAQTARALIEWYQCLPEPMAEQAEPEEEQKVFLLRRADEVQSGDEIVEGQSTFLNVAIEVIDVTVRPYDQIEIRGLYNLGNGERCQETWTCNRGHMIRVLR